MRGEPAAVASGRAAVDELVGLLDLAAVEPTGDPAVTDRLVPLAGVFAGRGAARGPARRYGGLIAAQALAAAGRTVRSGRPVHSLHAYFIRPGDSHRPVTYLVETLRDGRSMSTRRVVAVQRETPIFFLTASFHDPGSGLEHAQPPPEVPPPDEVPNLAQVLARAPGTLAAVEHMLFAFDARYIGPPPWAQKAGEARKAGERAGDVPRRAWVRVAGKLPDDPLVHAGALTFISDLPLLLSSMVAGHGQAWRPGDAGVSIDHTVWFHRPCRADEWLLYDCRSPWAAGGRGLATGGLYAMNGDLVATVAQEGLLLARPAQQAE
ncbi:acyl-CoA thioesterase [Micromonospora eburnea]|uniref:Acyl-CoA thioesterase-2 n=1 Tax=Micromonospora eburnea TaxID=227316 RepID=A0A1C6V0A0_9ACTN|nr:acyl-CoA thioesterase domain-containing protein [Micromonospora eburnea]SCL59719.1 acyl-CoA thioesterase-2 [Micromonospora eburnea]